MTSYRESNVIVISLYRFQNFKELPTWKNSLKLEIFFLKTRVGHLQCVKYLIRFEIDNILFTYITIGLDITILFY